MNGPYTHRNGETDAPAEYGLYLARHERGFPMFVRFLDDFGVDNFFMLDDQWELDLSNEYFAGVRWWGPISLPANFDETPTAELIRMVREGDRP